ncbi:sulfite exporter TauE/SafE family protein [Thermomonas brevis]|uniref:Sulfite exporter TauE/SafE family protein n=1 Tax=Thermomonas brevis TaxID=215691 RepID=A0A7G9QVA9_9GAMM|nr:sulfite exporter TauE/SafE family protein [Thermomonas brevis]QNN47284.1 sulfite exporter TauE/SafE family protein [Thermomonas brevis]
MPVDLLVLGAALLTGLLGGAHCVAMCGGIATGFSVHSRGGWWAALQPNLGRVGGYVLAGALVGGLGGGLLGIARIPQLGIAMRALVGIVLVVAGLRMLDRRGRLPRFSGGPGNRLWQALRPLQRRLLPADTAGKRIALGMLWGWMPCGLSTTLLAAAWLSASALHGALTMAAFGLGTLPVMVSLTWAGARIGQRLQRGAFRNAAGLLVIASGLLTLAAPWLMRLPAMHGVLAALGCRSLPG